MSQVSAAKKRKLVGGAATAAAPAVVAGGGWSGGIGSLLERLEATNASFLQSAAVTTMQAQLSKVKVRRCGRDRRWGTPSADCHPHTMAAA